MKVAKLFPIALLLFTMDKTMKGTCSMSAAQRQQTTNKNKVEKLLQELKSPVYKEKREVLSLQGVQTSIKDLEYFVTPEMFTGNLPRIMALNTSSANLGFAIAQKADMIGKIELIAVDSLAEVFGIEGPMFTMARPILRQATKVSIVTFCAEEKVDSLLEAASQDLLTKFSLKNVEDLLAAEAAASVYGKQIHPKSGDNPFLRELANASMSVNLSCDKNDSIIVERTKVLAYKKEDFAAVDSWAQDKHTEYQMARNSLMKQFKDAARELTQQYNKEYQEALAIYQKEMNSHAEDLKQYTAKVEALRGELLQEIAAFRIILSKASTSLAAADLVQEDPA